MKTAILFMGLGVIALGQVLILGWLAKLEERLEALKHPKEKKRPLQVAHDAFFEWLHSNAEEMPEETNEPEKKETPGQAKAATPAE